MSSKLKNKFINWLVVVVLLLGVILLPTSGVKAAGQLTGRSLTLSTSASNTSATWTFAFTTTETTALNGVSFQVCDAPSGTCNIPGSWTNSGSAAGTITGIGSGFALDNTAGYLRVKNNSNATTVTNPVSISFTTVTNPTLTNQTFYVRILTFSGDDFTTQVDNGVVAASINNQINVTASVAETLSFCVYTNANCAAAGTSAAIGALDSAAIKGAVSKMDASTNASTGYNIQYYAPTTLTDGSHPITAIGGTATASSPGTAQFGINATGPNTSITGSAAVSGSGSGAAATNYNTANSYAFVAATATTVASASAATNSNTYTVSYIANIPGSQAAGTYSTTFTYICTANF